jgi:hypothetical protein
MQYEQEYSRLILVAPEVHDPPYIHMNTGLFLGLESRPEAFRDVHTLRVRQSSFWSEGLIGVGGCKQAWPKLVVLRTIFGVDKERGARNRSGPTGGTA